MPPKQHTKKQRPVSFGYILQPLEGQASFIKTKMFGYEAIYLHGRLMLVLAEQKDSNWKGLLIPTFHEFHSSLQAEFKELIIHPVLKKWLYLPIENDYFESQAAQIVIAAKKNDKRLGVEPKSK